MWQSGRMKKLRRVLAGWLCVILVLSLSISSLAEKEGPISNIIPTFSSERKSSVLSHTPVNAENTGQAEEPDNSTDSEEEATPGDADEELINDLTDNETTLEDATPGNATLSNATPGDADLEYSIEELQKRIDALPEVQELEGEELGDFLLEIYRETVEIRELVESLSEKEQALLDVEKLEKLERFFVEEYPAVFAAENGVPVDTGIMDGALRWSVYDISAKGEKQKAYSLVYTWEGEERTATISSTNTSSQPNYLENYCRNIRKITFPDDGDITLGAYALYAFGMVEMEFPDSVTRMLKDALRGSVRVCKLTIPGSMSISGNIFYNTPADLKQLIITNGNAEKEGAIEDYAFKSSKIKELTFADTLKVIGTGAFLDNVYLTDLNLGAVRSIGEQAFKNNTALRNLAIPHTVEAIGREAFAGCSIEKLEFRGVSDEGVAADAIGVLKNGTVLIGKETKKLTGSLMKNTDGAAVLFEGDNVIEISGMPEDFHIEPLKGLNGTYHVDSQGVLYSQDDKTLIYCPPGISSCEVPAAVESIGADAFSRAKDLSAITFAAPQNITSLGDRAFFSCEKLSQVNGKTTVAEVMALFTGCQTWGKQLFLNTALSDAPRTGGILQTEKITISRNAEDARMVFGFTDSVTTVTGENSFENLTGDPIRLAVNADGPNVERYQYRIYLEPSGEDCSFGMNVDETLNLGTEGSTTPVTLRESDVAGIYYLEFDLQQGSTVSFDITPLYPSPVSPGGTLTIWGAILTEEEAAAAGNELKGNDGSNLAQMVEWKTVRSTFGLEKKPDSNMRNHLVLRGDGTANGDLHVAANGGDDVISYILNLKMNQGAGNQDSTFGKDYVQKIHCEDRLELPPGMHWQPEVLQAVQSGLYYYKTSNSNIYYYANINGKEKQLASLNIQIYGKVTEAYELKVVDDGVAFCWDLVNTEPHKQEIRVGNIYLTVNSECLRITQGDTEYGWDTQQTLKNRVVYTLQYAHSAGVDISAEADLSIAPPKSNITLVKGTSLSAYSNSYRGEDADFTITLKNEGAIAHNGLVRLEDTEIPEDFYIRPENIEKLFREQPFNQRLELTIAPVSLYETLDLGTATAIDGVNTVQITPGNSEGGTAKTENGRLVFAWEENTLMLNVYYDEQEGAEKKEQYPIDLTSGSEAVQTALAQAGYVVTYGAKYSLVWNLEGMPLYGGQVIEIVLNAALKDTFQYLQQAQREKGDFSTFRSSNQARLIYREDNEEKVINATDRGVGKLATDFYIYKNYSVNGADGESGAVLFPGSLVDYTVSLTHNGKGDTNNLPLTDYMKGPQQLLVPVEPNQTAEWAAGLEAEEIDGVSYYILSEDGGSNGVYKKVWVGVDEAGAVLCADSVKLVRENGQLRTTITWYYHNLPSGSYTKTVTYKVRMIVSGEDTPSAGSLHALNNEVWINARPADYLYNYIGMYITEFIFGKEIVVSQDGESTEELAKHSVIKKGDRIKYRLSLDLYSNTTGNIHVTDARDVLPETYGLFEWNQDNVNISYVDGQGNSLEENFAWHIEKTDASSKTDENEANNTYYTIRWDKLIIPVGDLAIYVTLDFPAETAAWDSYADMNNGKLIYNRFYIGTVEKSVSHELAYAGRVYLQKGVYQIGHFSEAKEFLPTNTTTHYVSEDGNDPRIVYYIQIYNGGQSRLYLTEIQDQLPQGFTLQDGRENTGYLFPTKNLVGSWGTTGENYTYTSYASGSASSLKPLVAVLKDADRSIKYKTAKVTVRSSDNALTGAQQLTFAFEAGNNSDAEKNTGYDSERNLCYLDQGEAISFAYAVDTGKAEETEDYAENTIAMPYLDYSGGGVEAAQGVVGAAQNDSLGQNVGLCRIMDQTEALQKGFFIPEADGNQKWLSSNVTVERGMIVPGITKEVSSYTNESGIDIAYTNGAGQNDRINWKLNLYNNGQVPLVDYTVKEVMEAPYTFTGDVTYTSYYKSGSVPWVVPVRLFTIEDRKTVPDTGQEIIIINTNNNFKEEISVAESESAAEWKAIWCNFKYLDSNSWYTFDCQIRFYRENGREVMELHMDELANQILAGEHAELMFSTKNTTPDRPYKIYVNNAMIRPVQPYKERFVTQGLNVTDETGKNAGVKNSAHVVISGAYATSSLKAVEKTDMETGEVNKADSTQTLNYLLLPDREKEFRYTLTVNNDNQNQYSIGELVFIDTLPEPGDHMVFSKDDERGSEFKVKLAEVPDVTVQTESADGVLKTLPSNSYKVDYAEKTTFEDADWKGAGTGWSDTHTSASRTVRVHIQPTTDKDLIPEKAKIHVTFNAQVDGNANAGDIAWNSFGYFYKMIDETAELFSAPQKVGVKIPEIPILEKRLLSASHEPFTAKTDQTFRFLIHQGAALEGVDYNDESAVKAAFSSDSAPSFTVVSVTVKTGDTSGQAVLSGLKQWKSQPQSDGSLQWEEDAATEWSWTDRTQYTIAELTMAPDYQFFRLCGSTVNGVSFYHQDDSPIRLDCENICPGWSVLLKKVDSRIETTLLPGAVFALYSPRSSDQIAEDNPAYLALEVSERPDLIYTDSGADGGAEADWYLADIRTTGESGIIIWEGLTEDVYLLKEVRAPKGYQMSETGYLEAAKPVRQEGNSAPLVLTVNVKNASAYVLPKTGGTGTLPVSMAGILCLCYAGCLYKKKREESGE